MKICLWSDGMWCEFDDIEEYTWMSDDYEVMEVPDDEDIDVWLMVRR